MDSLAALFAHVSPAARNFFAGNLCSTITFRGTAHLHLLQRGSITLMQAGMADVRVDRPSLLFFPEERPHTIVTDPIDGADLVCATVDLGRTSGNPISRGLPSFIGLELASHSELDAICRLLVAEGFGSAAGRQAALDRLFEYLLILLIRDVVAKGLVGTGVLAGLSHPRLAKALTAIHDEPARPWTLQDLADQAGMSRTRFAELFRQVVGGTPIDYLSCWRITTAQRLLAQGKQLKTVAHAVGYDNGAAFARRFGQVTGQSPRQWLASQHARAQSPLVGEMTLHE